MCELKHQSIETKASLSLIDIVMTVDQLTFLSEFLFDWTNAYCEYLSLISIIMLQVFHNLSKIYATGSEPCCAECVAPVFGSAWNQTNKGEGAERVSKPDKVTPTEPNSQDKVCPLVFDAYYTFCIQHVWTLLI